MSERPSLEKNIIEKSRRVGTQDLKYGTGLLFIHGDKQMTFRVLNEDHISVAESDGERKGKPEIIQFPHEEDYQHEISDGKVINVYGGRVDHLNRQRSVTYSAPSDLDVKVTVPPEMIPNKQKNRTLKWR